MRLLITRFVQQFSVQKLKRRMSIDYKRKENKNIGLCFTGMGIGAVLGIGYSVYNPNKSNLNIMNEHTSLTMLNEVPNINSPSYKVRYTDSTSNLKLTLFQYQNCPFCCKVRTFLDFNGISYNIIEVDPVLRQSIKWSTYRKVPILVVESNGKFQPLNDSSMIISALSTFLQNKDRDIEDVVKWYPFIRYIDENGVEKNEIMNKYFLMVKDDVEQELNLEIVSEERKWRKWVDDVLVHTLSPNIYRTKEEAFQAFNWFSDVGQWEKFFPEWERQLIIYIGAYAMWFIGKRLKKKYCLKEDVRQSLYDECNYWVDSIKKKKQKYMGGHIPNLADLAVYGVLVSIEGCSAFQDLLNNSTIKDWFFNMKIETTKHVRELT